MMVNDSPCVSPVVVWCSGWLAGWPMCVGVQPPPPIKTALAHAQTKEGPAGLLVNKPPAACYQSAD